MFLIFVKVLEVKIKTVVRRECNYPSKINYEFHNNEYRSLNTLKGHSGRRNQNINLLMLKKLVNIKYAFMIIFIILENVITKRL